MAKLTEVAMVRPLDTSEFKSAIAVTNDSELDLARACLTAGKALDFVHEVDIEACLAVLDGLADQVRAILGGNATDKPVLKVVRAINDVLFAGEHPFRGDINVLDPRNCLFHRVLSDRPIAIPITLSLLYLEVAQRVGLELEALNLPGLVVTGLLRPLDADLDFFIDPFRSGDIIFTADLEERLEDVYGYKMRLGEALKRRSEVPWRRRFVGRLLQTLKAAYLEQSDVERTFRAVELILCISPNSPAEIRDRGFCHFFEGRLMAARKDLTAYVERLPLAEDAETVRKIIAGMGDAQF